MFKRARSFKWVVCSFFKLVEFELVHEQVSHLRPFVLSRHSAMLHFETTLLIYPDKAHMPQLDLHIYAQVLCLRIWNHNNAWWCRNLARCSHSSINHIYIICIWTVRAHGCLQSNQVHWFRRKAPLDDWHLYFCDLFPPACPSLILQEVKNISMPPLSTQSNSFSLEYMYMSSAPCCKSFKNASSCCLWCY